MHSKEEIALLEKNAALYRQDIVNKITNARHELEHVDKKSLAALVGLTVVHALVEDYWKPEKNSADNDQYYKGVLKKEVTMMVLGLVKNKLEQLVKERNGDGQ
jgi:hypothetical protein